MASQRALRALHWLLCCALLSGPAMASQQLLLAQLQLAGVTSIAYDEVGNYGDPEEKLPYQRQLIGLFVDGTEKRGLHVLFDGDAYMLPLEPVLASIGASLASDREPLEVVTPIGNVKLEPENLRIVENQLMIKETALTEQLQLASNFDSASYAMRLELPWWRTDGAEADSVPALEPRFSPPSASVRNLRADLSYLSSAEDDYLWGEYYSAGNLAGGAWEVRLEQDADGEVRPIDYHWFKNYGKTQVLQGTSAFSLHPLVNTIEQTGLQTLYSTEPLGDRRTADITRANGNREISTGTRTIAGQSEPGAIAELRVNNGRVARTRVRLDGHFEFSDVDLPSRGYSDVKVLVLDRSGAALIETLDYSRRAGAQLLKKGQHSVFGALGEEGNTLDDRQDSRGTSTAMQWRYGITENLTAEIGYQHDGEEASTVLAASMSLGGNWYGTLGYAASESRDALEMAVEGGGEYWDFDLTAREYRDDREGVEQNQWLRYLNYRYQVSDSLNLGVAGRDEQDSRDSSSFLLPTATWNDGDKLALSAWPNTDGNYRLDGRYRPSYRDTVRYTLEEDQHVLDYRRQSNSGYEYYGNFSTSDFIGDRYELGLIRYSDNAAFERMQVALVSTDSGNLGYLFDWESHLMPGISSRLRLSNNAYRNDSSQIDDELIVQWDLTMDFAVNQNRLMAAESSMGSYNSAALAGELLINDRPIPADLGITQLSVVVDGNAHTASVQGGQYYLAGLKPGLHLVSLDSKFLPIQLLPQEGQSYWVRLENAASTNVPFKLEARYAIAGRVRENDGVVMPNQALIVRDSKGETLSTVYTDMFGLYRADNLAPGDYRVVLQADGMDIAEREVKITNEFLFDQDVIVP